MTKEELDVLLNAMREEHVDGSVVRGRVLDQIQRRRWWIWAPWPVAALAVAALVFFAVQPVKIAPPGPVLASIPPAPLVKTHVPARHVSPRHRRIAKAEPVTIKILTEDPNVVIYLLSDNTGE